MPPGGPVPSPPAPGPGPAALPRRSRAGWWLALAIALPVLLLGLVVGGLLVARQDDAVDAPEAWDPRVADLVGFVERERGGAFDHPVRIEFLTEDEYREDAQDDSDESADPEGDAEDEAQLRALGWLAPDAGLDDSQDDLTADETAAYYSPGTRTIVVRGVPEAGQEMAASLRATIVHELTHAWQDQQGWLDREPEDSEEDFAFTAVVEGDAMRVEYAYVDTLSDDEKDEYDDVFGGGAESAASSTAPGLEANMAGPYVVGSSFVDVLDGDGGNRRVDEVLAAPPVTSEQVMFPAVFDAGLASRFVAPVEVPEGADPIGDPDVAGAWDLLVTLGGRVDPSLALRAARAWAGGSWQAWRTDGGQVCVGLAFTGDDAERTDVMEEALDQWAGAGPAGAATVARAGDEVVHLTACDTGGEDALADGDRLDQAVSLAGAHAAIVSFSADALGLAAADCAVSRLVERVDPDVLTADDLSDAEIDRVSGLFDELSQECADAEVTG